MNGFDVVLFLTLACAAVALVKQRTATFIFSANMAVIARSLSLISDHGRPPALAFVPTWVFQRRMIDVALIIFVISICLLVTCVLLPSRKAPPPDVDLPPLPRWALWTLVGYFVVLGFSMRSVADVQYASQEQGVYWVPSGGIQAFAAAALMYELYRRIRAGLLSPVVAFGLFFGVFFFTDYMKGQTGMASGFVFSAAMLFFGGPGASRRRYVWILGVLVVLISIGSVLRIARLSFYTEGSAAFGDAIAEIIDREQHKEELGEGAETASSGHEFAALTLECITLYESGNDRGWRSVYLPVLYTLEPAFLDYLAGWHRPKEAAAEIREHFTTNGGVAIFGEAYWNGGYIGVVAILAALLFGCYAIDRNYRHGFFPLLLYCNFAPLLLQGVGYGLSYTIRGVINGLLQAGIYYAWVYLFGRARVLLGATVESEVPGLREVE